MHTRPGFSSVQKFVASALSYVPTGLRKLPVGIQCNTECFMACRIFSNAGNLGGRKKLRLWQWIRWIMNILTEQSCMHKQQRVLVEIESQDTGTPSSFLSQFCKISDSCFGCTLFRRQVGEVIAGNSNGDVMRNDVMQERVGRCGRY